jgi:hypothetical protein
MRVLFGQSSKTFCFDLVLHPVVAWENVLARAKVGVSQYACCWTKLTKQSSGPWLRRMLDVWTGGLDRRFRAFDRRRMTMTVEVSSVQLLLYLVVVSHY